VARQLFLCQCKTGATHLFCTDIKRVDAPQARLGECAENQKNL
jgi:hypothetical protein